MRHRCTPDTLTLLAIGEISTWRAARLRRHLANCPDCRAEWESILQTITLARSFQERKVPNTMQARILTELAQRNTSSCPIPARLLTPRRWLLVVTFAVVLLPVLLWSPLRHSRNNIAFAQVVRAMQTVRTLHYRDTRLWLNKQGQRNIVDKECWINWQPMLFASREISGKAVRTVLADEQKTLLFDSGRKTLVPHEPDHPSLREELMYEVTAPTRESRGVWTSASDRVEGHALLRFEQNWEDSESRNNVTVWAEPDTLRVVRSERSQYNRVQNATYREVREQFRYNETPPAAIFAPLAQHTDTPQPK